MKSQLQLFLLFFCSFNKIFLGKTVPSELETLGEVGALFPLLSLKKKNIGIHILTNRLFIVNERTLMSFLSNQNRTIFLEEIRCKSSFKLLFAGWHSLFNQISIRNTYLLYMVKGNKHDSPKYNILQKEKPSSQVVPWI